MEMICWLFCYFCAAEDIKQILLSGSGNLCHVMALSEDPSFMCKLDIVLFMLQCHRVHCNFLTQHSDCFTNIGELNP